MPAPAHSSAAASRPATRAPGPAAQVSPRFSPSHLPVPLPTSSAAALSVLYPPPAQPMPRLQPPGFPPAVPSSLRWLSRAALGSAAVLSQTRSPSPLVRVALRLIRERTRSSRPYKEMESPAPRVGRPASSPDVRALTLPGSPPVQNIQPPDRRHRSTPPSDRSVWQSPPGNSLSARRPRTVQFAGRRRFRSRWRATLPPFDPRAAPLPPQLCCCQWTLASSPCG